MRETRDWLNAIPMDIATPEPDGVDLELVRHEVGAIRTALASGATQVDCFITRLPVVEAIVNQLSDEELVHVSFPGTEVQSFDT